MYSKAEAVEAGPANTKQTYVSDLDPAALAPYGSKASAFWMLCPWPFLRQMQSGVAARDAAFAVAVCLSLCVSALSLSTYVLYVTLDVQYCTWLFAWPWLGCVRRCGPVLEFACAGTMVMCLFAGHGRRNVMQCTPTIHIYGQHTVTDEHSP